MIRLVLALALMLAAVGRASADCGDAGDPGFRGPDGTCVEWCKLAHVCGSSGKRCSPEKVSPIILVLQKIKPGDPSLPRCSGCGCKKGPGYRMQNGSCASWTELHASCGSSE
jgi:hypothetical protein